MAKGLVCPRCEQAQGRMVSRSPVKGAFEVYRCGFCNYVWRSTEDLSAIRKLPAHLVERAQAPYPWPPLKKKEEE